MPWGFASIGLWAQVATADNHLFVAPPAPIALAPQTSTPAAVPNPIPPPTILNFDQLPGPQWYLNDCFRRGSGTISRGILTINSPSDCYEYILYDPLGDWNQYVDNKRGWIVEANIKVDPSTVPDCSFGSSSLLIWANDRTNLIIFGIIPNEICIAYPEIVHYPMNTTDSFHVYRIETREIHTRIYVDGQLAISHVFSHLGSGTQALVFGDGTLYNTSLSKWDYFGYNVFPPSPIP